MHSDASYGFTRPIDAARFCAVTVDPSSPQISFIIALYNNVELTRVMLRTLDATVDLSEHEVVLVDDASTDGTATFLESLTETPYRILRNQTNQGFAVSNNRGSAAARGRYLCLLNNDLELTPGWLEPMTELLESAPNVGAVGNIQRNRATGLVDHAGVYFDLEGMPSHAWKNRKRLPPGPFSERNAATAACLLLRRETFQEMGGFDEGYRNGMEDIDLCVRLRLAGQRILVSHRSVVRHHISRSPGRHDRNASNSERFRELRAPSCVAWGQTEWPREYLARYARHWWKLEPRKALTALRMLLIKSSSASSTPAAR